jgi:hypothetical protein
MEGWEVGPQHAVTTGGIRSIPKLTLDPASKVIQPGSVSVTDVRLEATVKDPEGDLDGYIQACPPPLTLDPSLQAKSTKRIALGNLPYSGHPYTVQPQS